MFDFLENLRQKTEGTKKKIAFFGAFLLAGIIFVVWLSVVYPSFNHDQIPEEVASRTNPSPLSAFSDTLSVGFSAIGDLFSKIKETVSSFTTAPAYYVSTSTNKE